MEVGIHLLISSIAALPFFCLFLSAEQYRERATDSNSKNFLKRYIKHIKQERRSHPRYKTSLRIKYKTPFGEGISWIKDISESGIRVFLDKALESGTFLTIEITLPYDRQPIFARGSIIWAQGDDAGLIFDEVKENDLDRIFNYITHKERMILEKK